MMHSPPTLNARRWSALAAGAVAALLVLVPAAYGAANAPGAAGTAVNAAAVDASGPFQLIDSSSKILLAALDAHRAVYRRDPQKLYKVIDEVLLPHFDVDYAAKLVLAQYWRTATPDQRKRFIDAFYHSLLPTYAPTRWSSSRAIG